ncbi:MAG: hypothetical protein WC889_14835 [Myxococcota bacterium]|jgi:hypothetical protein
MENEQGAMMDPEIEKSLQEAFDGFREMRPDSTYSYHQQSFDKVMRTFCEIFGQRVASGELGAAEVVGDGRELVMEMVVQPATWGAMLLASLTKNAPADPETLVQTEFEAFLVVFDSMMSGTDAGLVNEFRKTCDALPVLPTIFGVLVGMQIDALLGRHPALAASRDRVEEVVASYMMAGARAEFILSRLGPQVTPVSV